MSEKFYAKNRETGERWKSNKDSYLIMYDSGCLGVVTTGSHTCIENLDHNKWETCYNLSLFAKVEKYLRSKIQE